MTQNKSDYEIAKEAVARVDAECRKASKALGDFCAPHKGNMGLIPDAIKATWQYKALKLDYDASLLLRM